MTASDYKNIPAELRSRTQWVVWKSSIRPGSAKPTKVPYQATRPARKASSTDSETWGTFEEALQVVDSGRADGPGFVFTDDDPYCGIDIDGCVDNHGLLDKKTLSMIKELGTYSEYSPGSGVHVIGIAELSGKGNRSGNVERYDRGRFFCMTGRRIRGTKAKLAPFDPNIAGEFINGKKEQNTPATLDQEITPGERHPELVSMAARLLLAGVDRQGALVALRARAAEIGLPKREEDECGRIVDYYWNKRSFDKRVAQTFENMQVSREAKNLYETSILGDVADKLEDDETVADELLLPDDPVIYAIDDLMPSDGNALLSADRKAGKTSLGLTVAKSLVDGTPFMNSFAVEPPEGRKVLYLNYELSRKQMRRWLRKLNLKHPERLLMRTLRGRSLPFWQRDTQMRLVEYCKRNDVWFIVIDPQMMACKGLVTNENDNMEFAAFHGAIDEVKQLAGIDCCLVVHHIGKSDKERARGASRIEDWPDALWYLTKEENGSRTFKAEGRDVDLKPIALEFDEQTGLYRWDGMSRGEAKLEVDIRAFCVKVGEFYRSDLSHPVWPGGNSARDLIPVKTDKVEFLARAEGLGYVTRVGRIGQGARYHIELTQKGWGCMNDV